MGEGWLQLLMASGELETLLQERLSSCVPDAEASNECAGSRAIASPHCFHHGWQSPLCQVLDFRPQDVYMYHLNVGVEGKKRLRDTREASSNWQRRCSGAVNLV